MKHEEALRWVSRAHEYYSAKYPKIVGETIATYLMKLPYEYGEDLWDQVTLEHSTTLKSLPDKAILHKAAGKLSPPSTYQRLGQRQLPEPEEMGQTAQYLKYLVKCMSEGINPHKAAEMWEAENEMVP